MQGYNNGELYCEFQRTPTLTAQDGLEIDFDLESDNYFLLLAQGELNPGAWIFLLMFICPSNYLLSYRNRYKIRIQFFLDGSLKMHYDKRASPESVRLSETIAIIGAVK